MKGVVHFFFLLVVSTSWAGGVPPGALVNFEGLPAGTLFGSEAGDRPGDIVLTQNDVAMRVQNFQLQSFVGFYRAEVGGDYASLFSSTPLETNNITVEFDFDHVGFEVDRVTFEFREFGGMQNFSVNSQALYEVASLSLLPSEVAPGVSATIDGGLVTLLGPIDRFRVGGQELVVDNVMAVPEPFSLLLLTAGALCIACRRRR